MERDVLRELIEEYSMHPCLWEVKSADYHKREKKNIAMARLLAIYKDIDPDATLKTVKDKIQNLRSSYRKELRKVQLSEKLGYENVHVPNLWYFDLFWFLKEEENTRHMKGISDSDTPSQKDKNDPKSDYIPSAKMTRRMIFEERRTALEEEKFLFFKETEERKLQMEEKRMALEEKRVEEELRIKTMESEQNFFLNKLRLEKEMDLKELELKYKYNKD